MIVGSILLAFGIDAWWEERQQRILEVQYAERLKADLVAPRFEWAGDCTS